MFAVQSYKTILLTAQNIVDGLEYSYLWTSYLEGRKRFSKQLMRRIKFCHLIDSSSYNHLLYNSVKFSDREKFAYTVISLAPSGGLQEQMRELDVDSFSLNCLSRKQYPSVVWKLIAYFGREKFDIVQVHSFEASVVGLTAARIARVPVRIFTGHHSHEVPLYNNRKLTLVDGFLSKRLANNVISPSAQMKDIFIEAENVPPEMITVIPHGMDLDAWRTAAKIESNLRKELAIEDKIIFGAVGRLFWVKDFEILVRAFAKIAEKRTDIVLLIAGNGSDKEKLQNLIDSLKMRKQIFLIGNRTDIASVMSSFDVFVHSSLAESFGLVFIEAFALGKPIISTKVGIAIDIVVDGENGFLVNPDDADGLTDAFEKMLNVQGKWKLMGENGKQIAEKFSVKLTQTACDNYYSRLVNA